MIQITINKAVLELTEGDITEQETDAIVNAANSSLLGGGGVDGAIHRAGGHSILEECKKIGGCPTGEARITTGGNLKARYVIHTVGPVYHDGKRNEPELLANTYKNSLILASQYNLRSVAFPSISTGAYGFPMNEAAVIALKTVMAYLKTHTDIRMVRFVLFNLKAYQIYEDSLKAFMG
ncbi:MAG: O-acetyl-ADP-ribose deacetylase [Candidatus Brocadia sp.]|nr:O-acetyl-ADP-ribose deacetylase [Candidatus Brocadia fulgida]MCC6326730.1 O-acetyl-ADP-ribose deacetylase [Candidatus Brocadia sp.]MCE7911086.1 O-acetyl-ADP-ribose deacetylase [Candidatus Brocadia sp. AMX3]OQY98651.1 MAG: O-acetyl-ADP-ribose deacetylase [Candidatus Brocadia sp. UTAMX2]MDG5996995.1 O-acetyl-ADP-ribose deacetylase [Candidatus Brocadia sp.]